MGLRAETQRETFSVSPAQRLRLGKVALGGHFLAKETCVTICHILFPDEGEAGD